MSFTVYWQFCSLAEFHFRQFKERLNLIWEKCHCLLSGFQIWNSLLTRWNFLLSIYRMPTSCLLYSATTRVRKIFLNKRRRDIFPSPAFGGKKRMGVLLVNIEEEPPGSFHHDMDIPTGLPDSHASYTHEHDSTVYNVQDYWPGPMDSRSIRVDC